MRKSVPKVIHKMCPVSETSNSTSRGYIIPSTPLSNPRSDPSVEGEFNGPPSQTPFNYQSKNTKAMGYLLVAPNKTSWDCVRVTA